MPRRLLLLLLVTLRLSPAQDPELTVDSPGRVLRLSFLLDQGEAKYRLLRHGREVIEPSRLGFVLRGLDPLDREFKLVSHEIREFRETWTQPWGEKREILNHYRELRVDLVRESLAPLRLTLVFRVSDDGLGFRYVMPEQPGLDSFVIMDEVTEFTFTNDHTTWWIPAYFWNRYEYLYRRSPLSEIDTVHTPVTMESENGLCLSIHEAALTNFASMTLARKSGLVLEADLVPWSDGVKVRALAPMYSPWRTIQVADSPGGLITSYLVLNLNEPNRLEDVSWIEPGKYVGIWWEMHLGLSTWGRGSRHGATTEKAKYYIDFAAKHGFGGVLVEGWNIGWDGDWLENCELMRFTETSEDFNPPEVAEYARVRGTRLIGHHETGGGVGNYEEQMTEAFAYYEDLGVRAVKTGYVNHARGIPRIDENGVEQGEWHHGQFMVRHYRKAVEEAARHRIMLDVHEPIKDTGIRRTYPNMMTREGARGQEFNAWDPGGGNPPEHTTILPFTRMLAGPMDFTPGIFDLLFEEARPDNRVSTTLAKQLALYVVLYSPLQMAADLPENYEARPGPFRFVRDVPVDWNDTRVLHGEIGDCITIVRQGRHSEDWYLGSITDEESRLLEAQLSFLDPNRTWVAEIYRDGTGAHWRDNPYDMEMQSLPVDHTTVLPLRLAPGGGQAIRFRPAED